MYLAFSLVRSLPLEKIADSPLPFNKDYPSIGNYPMSTSQLGVSFDHRVIALRPRGTLLSVVITHSDDSPFLVCANQDKTNQVLIHCPTPPSDPLDDWPCIRYSDLCNGTPDCPQHEDEHPTFCMYHNLVCMKHNTHLCSYFRKTLRWLPLDVLSPRISCDKIDHRNKNRERGRNNNVTIVGW